jgi:putative molybdopterin biosynthesis protein
MLLTTREVAALLRVHPKHVYRLLRRGLPGRRVGGEWRFDRDEVLAWGSTSDSPTSSGAERRPAPLLAANEDLVVDLLLGELRGAEGELVGRVPADSARGIELLERGAVVATGFHGGDPPPTAVRVACLALFDRELGLIYPRRRGAPDLSDLPAIRFASRPVGAGSRVHLDAALRAQRLNPRQLYARAQVFTSPRDVACAVARGEADAGITTRAWASRLGLGFTRLVVERYQILITADRLGDAAVLRLCAAAQGKAFAQALRGIPGCDPSPAGTLTVRAA